MTRLFISLPLLLSSWLILSACEQKEMTEARVTSKEQTYHYIKDIKPILDRKCLACHSCYDAPCQLKMESSEGLDRGASKKRVYDGDRLEDIPPTRLYIDAHSSQDWRDKGFYSVLSAYVNSKNETTAPLMQQMLDLGRSKALSANKKIPETIQLGFDRISYCPAPGEFEAYQAKNPHGGMPLAVSGLDNKEYEMLSTWVKQGAKVEPEEIVISEEEKSLIIKWEDWLNQQDNRSKLISRYLYEHLFLGHLYLRQAITGKTPQFYRMIRSYTPTGKKPIPVASVRPNDDPVKPFFYRLVPIKDAIVHKTHITYRFDLHRFKRYQQLFTNVEWNVEELPAYTYKDRANPFATFAAMPARQRYIFLLDDAEFFVRNFIRGPVCRGQIATNVIRDQFWLMFEHPDHELYTNNNSYQLSVNNKLGLPGEKTSLLDFGSQWLNYLEDRNNYLDSRQKAYQKKFPKGAEFKHIWAGNEDAFLTIFRHHNSASVTRGWQGDIPLTAWLMDYPLFERTYYELVAGFDVFGSLSHQAQTRLYFDLIRNGSETNFLRMMPPSKRKSIYEQWYQSVAKIKTNIAYDDLDIDTPSQISYTSNEPKKELLETVLQGYPNITGGTDVINRCHVDCDARAGDGLINKINQSMHKIASIPLARLKAIKYLPEVSFVRINLDTQKSENQPADFLVYTLLRNRQHSSVAFILGEELRYKEDLDTLTILPEPIGSYPNLMLQFNASEVDHFIKMFEKIDSQESFDQFIERWGIRRMSPHFWNIFHSISDYHQIRNPLEAGIYDMNRYGNW